MRNASYSSPRHRYATKSPDNKECEGHEEVDTGEGQVLVDLQRVPAGDDDGEQQGHQHDGQRVMASEPAHEEADVPIPWREVGPQPSLDGRYFPEPGDASKSSTYHQRADDVERN